MSTAPRVAIVYEPESVPLLRLAALTSRKVFDVVWVADGIDVPILRRLGTVLSAGDGSIEELACRLAQLDVAGVTTFADSQIERTAEIGRHLGTPAHTDATARRLVDKIAQRQALAHAGVPGPAFVGIRSQADIVTSDELLRDLRYPVVVKPASGWGGRDTHYASDPTAVVGLLERQRDAVPFRAMIVEECLGSWPPSTRAGFGDYVSAEVAVGAGVPTVLAVTGRMPLAEPFRETGAFLPSTLTEEEHDEVAVMAVRAAQALGVRQGCLHIEIKLTADGPRVIEVNGRVPGGGIADLVTAHTGIDLFECALAAALGTQLPHEPSPARGGVHYQLALQPPIGQRVRLKPDWSPALRSIDGVRDVMLRSAEAEVSANDGSYGYLLMASGMASDHGALSDTYREMYALMEEVG